MLEEEGKEEEVVAAAHLLVTLLSHRVEAVAVHARHPAVEIFVRVELEHESAHRVGLIV